MTDKADKREFKALPNSYDELTPLKRPHISYSEWRLFNRCQHRWFLDYKCDLRNKIDSVATVFGTSVHLALEHYKSKEKSHTIEEVKEIFVKDFTNAISNLEDTRNQKQSLIEAGHRILDDIQDYFEQSKVEIIKTEYALYEKIDRSDDIEINFKGFIDFIAKTKDGRGQDCLLISDYKTCSWGWKFEQKTDEAVIAQLRLYKHFLAKKLDLNYSKIKTSFILLKKKPGKKIAYEVVPVSTGEETIMRTVGELQKDITKMQGNIFSKNYNECINTYGDTCPYYGTNLCTKGDK